MVAAARVQTSPEADAVPGRSSALVGSSPRRAPDDADAKRSCALSCDGAAFVWRESQPAQAADQPRGCEQRMPAPARAPTCQATLQRASRRTSGCGGSSRLTSVELVVTAAIAGSRDSLTPMFAAAETSLTDPPPPLLVKASVERFARSRRLRGPRWWCCRVGARLGRLQQL